MRSDCFLRFLHRLQQFLYTITSRVPCSEDLTAALTAAESTGRRAQHLSWHDATNGSSEVFHTAPRLLKLLR
jgi:hypothetical protein